ncbi:MAG: cob(I)yrinic acid a,c-diamide adenosyltransferase [archaeon]|jgi:cob(I)alamin adenosyltransferase|nr:cob(I)yrinic acid a,c-diamide adenosyltransferase [archaeon]MDD2477781.1 cob(I)yrinic acid a,c-diamide adenosyltransferase [Candidatus ainarchaeum sp.]MDD3084902.1 cob(I)yrinic acid a,c-diamide adenosyltransferase [Candidatus ainarchaeum sp.]MDD4221181.1 cob(I)yrinic acid a,c-diamide adenosyltransferase [Candidatus ainarchaeum sp.]MDD4662867.1 cob(I)yrinic acid a,c-diamide adenosyltransferase [Candidatus ainarchaeum sp.]
MEKVKLQIYTGEGKGKTSSAIGLCIRALAYNNKIYFLQFLKFRETGEEKTFKSLKNITFKKFGINEFIINNKITDKNKKIIRKGIDYLFNVLDTKKINILVLDEINLVYFYKIITKKEINNIIKICNKKNIELILTGRFAHKDLIKKADLVTEFKEIKHYYKNTKAREGIEY